MILIRAASCYDVEWLLYLTEVPPSLHSRIESSLSVAVFFNEKTFGLYPQKTISCANEVN